MVKTGAMTTPSLDPVLVTGCSTGIGRATATLLVKAGHTVYATARRPETLRDLEDAGARILELDVTSEGSMRAAVDHIEAQHGQVGTLVNNAGYGEYGTIEETDLDNVRKMFETNVIGLARMTQLVLPAMRCAHAGRIVNIGSMGGRFAFPVGGYYHATKYAVEALTDSLRNEVRGFGIAVVLIEPGPIRTSFEETITGSLTHGASGNGSSPYAGLVQSVSAANANAYSSKVIAAPPEKVARTILKAIETDHPRSRYVITPTARALIALRTFGGDHVWDAMVRRQFGG